MDVILDSNRYLSDPKMAGNSFANLFDYLRKTGSDLVVPKVVFDEVIARYEERLKGCIQEAEAAVSALNAVSARSIKLGLALDVDDEIKALKARIEKPAKQVKVAIQTDHSPVDLAEVVRRGIRRIAPANQKGEQLRDVVVWLSVLGYSASGKSVAFITDDSDFWSDKSLKKGLQEEITKRSAAVSVYRTIDDFIKEKAPAPVTASKEWAEKYVASDRVEEIAAIQSANQLSRKLGLDLHLIFAIVRDIQFRDGAIYEVGAKSQFAELTYCFAASVEAEEKHAYINLSIEDLWANRFRIGQPEFFKPTAQHHVFARALEPAATPLTLAGPYPLSGVGSFLNAEPVAPRAPLRVLVLARGLLKVSLRIVEDKASNIEFDGFADIEFTDDAADTKDEPKSGGGI